MVISVTPFAVLRRSEPTNKPASLNQKAFTHKKLTRAHVTSADNHYLKTHGGHTEHHNVLHTVTQGLSSMFNKAKELIDLAKTFAGSKFTLKTEKAMVAHRARAA